MITTSGVIITHVHFRLKLKFISCTFFISETNQFVHNAHPRFITEPHQKVIQLIQSNGTWQLALQLAGNQHCH